VAVAIIIAICVIIAAGGALYYIIVFVTNASDKEMSRLSGDDAQSQNMQSQNIQGEGKR